MIKQICKILIVDASVEDQVIFRYFLEQITDHLYECLNEEPGSTLVETCLKYKPDCILLTYHPPFNDFLNVLKKINPDPLHPDFPVIILTETEGEILAVKALINSAQYCLVKENVTSEELHISIVSAIEIVEIRKKQRESLQNLKKSEEYLKIGIKVADFAIADIDYLNDKIILSAKAAALFDLGDEEITVPRFRVHETFHPDDHNEIFRLMKESFDSSGKGWFMTEHRIILKNGDIRWLNVRKQIFFDDRFNPARPTRGILAARDITKRKESEEKFRLYEKVVLNTKDAVMITEAEPIDSPGPRIVYVNPAFTEMSGYTPEEVIGKTPRILQGPKTDRKQLDKIRAALAKWESTRVEITNYHKDGTEFEVEFDINPVADEKGWFTHWVSVQRDVTTRKRAEEKVIASEYLLQGTIDSLTAHIALLDKNGVIVSVNEAWRKFAVENDFQTENYGIGQKYLKTYISQNPDEYDKYAEQAIEGLHRVTDGEIESFALEYPCHTPEEQIWFMMRITRFKEINDDLRVVVAHENITTRKIAEEKLRISEQRMSLAMKGAQIGTFDWNIKTGRIEWSREIEEVSAMSPDDFDNTISGLINFIHPLDREMLQNRIAEAFKTGEYECEFRMLKGDGTIRWVIGKGSIIYDEAGEPERLIGVDIDITKRKAAEEELRENQRFTESIIETAPSVLYTFNLNTLSPTFMTKQSAKVLGYEFDEFKNATSELFKEIIHPDDVKSAQEHFRQIRQAGNGKIYELEYRMRHKSGEWRWFRSRDMVFKRDKNGEPEEILGIALDITERRLAEEKLRESQMQTFLALEAGNTIAFTWDIKADRVRRMHSDFDTLPETDGDTLSGVAEQIYEEDRERFLKNIQTALANPQKPYAAEYRISKPNEKIAWLTETGKFTLDENGKPLRLTGISSDITERKQAEELLRESRERLEATNTNAPIGIVETTLDGDYLSVNDEFCRISGYTKDELLNLNFQDVTYPEDYPRNLKMFKKLVAGEFPSFQMEKRYVRKDGSTIWVEVNRTLLKKADGKPSYVIGAIVDISERKQAEEQLRRNHETFYNLVQNAPFGIYIVDADFRLIQISKGAQSVFSNIEPLINRDFAEILRTIWAEPFASETIEIFRHTLATGEPYRAADTSKQRGNLEDTESYDWKIERIMLPDGQFGVVCYFYDLTERLQFEEKRRESEERMRLVLSAAKIGIWIYDLVDESIYWSPEHYEIFRTEEFDGTIEAFQKFVHPADLKMVESHFSESIENRVAYQPEFRIICADGETRWIGNFGHAEYDENGKPLRFLSTVFDITERKRRELNLAFKADLAKDFAPLSSDDEILRLAGERVAEHLNLSHCIFTEINETADETRVLYDRHAPGVPDLMGVYKLGNFHTEEERKQLSAGKLTIIDDVRDDPRSKAAAEEFEALGIRALITAPFISNGQWKFALSVQHSEPYQWRTDEIELLGDLSSKIYVRIERARAEKALRESEERFRALFNSIDEGFCEIELIFDEHEKPVDFRFIQANPAHGRLTGLQNVIGQTMRELVPGIEDFWFEIYGKVVLTGEAVRFEDKSESMNIWFEVYASRIGGDQSRRVAIVFNNITDRKLIELEREERLGRESDLRREAQDANRSKDEFLAILSHELRTPLNAMAGWTQILLDENLDRKTIKKAVEVISRNVRQQNTLIEDLLDVSRIISGKMRLDKENLALVPIIYSTIDTVLPSAEKRTIEIQSNIDASVNEIEGDKMRLQQIITNLLNNAIKFSHENQTVLVTLKRFGDTARLSVKDSGIGIAPDLLPQIFDRFKQADGSSKRNYSGLGLGLTIVKHLVELHGGTISAYSDGKNLGAEFIVELPLAAEENNQKIVNNYAKTDCKDRSRLDGVKILLVDDDLDALDMLCFALEQESVEVVCVGSAKDAIEVLENQNFDLLISDLGMPEMDGFDLIHEVRRNEEKSGSAMIPAIALTGYVSTEDKDRVLAAGFQRHLPKPVIFEELFAIMENLLEK